MMRLGSHAGILRAAILWAAILRAVLARRAIARAAIAALVLAVAAGIMPQERAVAQTARTVDVRDFPSVQAAVDSVRASGGLVYLPAGQYTLPAKLRLYSNTGIFGDGMDRTVLRLAGGVVDHMLSNNSIATTSTNITVRGLTLSGPGANASGDNCCFGLRFINVTNSTIAHVAADDFGLDGFYFGYNQQNGVNGVRLSGCRAIRNGRNGISITHGSGNVVDGCHVIANNRREAVAGIDLEPDAGLNVSNNKIVGNIANDQNVGIQLLRPFRDYAVLAENAICSNRVTGNRNAGIYDLKGFSNIYVDNRISNSGTDFLVDPSARIGGQFAGSCGLPALPPPPSPPGSTPPPAPPPPPPTPPPPTSCDPRPRVGVSMIPSGPGRILVTIQATPTAGAPNNRLQAFRFARLDNAVAIVADQTYAANGSAVTFAPQHQQVSFFVQRTRPGAATVQMVVRDSCGDWPTFVGLGANVP